MPADGTSSSAQPTQNLPACDYLGKAVNLSSLNINPGDLKSVRDNSSLVPIVKLDNTSRSPVTPPGSGTAYWLPGNTVYDNLGSESKARDFLSERGNDLIEKLNRGADLGVNYLSVGVTAGIHYSYSSALKSTSAYGAYSFDQQVYGAHLDQSKWYGWVEPAMLADGRNLPAWTLTPGVYNSYQTFFQKWGTHLITRSYLGNRYQLMVIRDTMSQESVRKFNLQVKAEFAGIIKGGGGDWGSEQEKKEYLNNRQISCHVLGGHPTENGNLARSPESQEAFEKWLAKRDAAYDAHLSFQTQSLATFLENSSDPSYKAVGKKLAPALEYCCKFALLQGKLAYEVDKGSSSSVQWGECKLPALPGLELRAIASREWRVEAISASHVKVTRSGIGTSDALVDITVKAPPVEAIVTLNAALNTPTSRDKIMRFFVLSPYGPAPRQHETTVMTHDVSGKESQTRVYPTLKAFGVFN
ncbi:hypothetical protein F5B22DRAFT_652264 [Xylaria bambusicola]|uniref:uncharacterized protein n=1 Tax=Xylaria bambusicola TaxID=326684 RepID=UPI0020078757|nr:uncharacterized protein F5B22DRAFT_652264 [Xylaria bambusicola]KAI0503266.1 hypothetical protein F5B22DRAFT_652264 [Xylaria bambusicola]